MVNDKKEPRDETRLTSKVAILPMATVTEEEGTNERLDVSRWKESGKLIAAACPPEALGRGRGQASINHWVATQIWSRFADRYNSPTIGRRCCPIGGGGRSGSVS